MIARSISVPVAVVAVLLSVVVSVQVTARIPPALSAVEGRRVEILFLGHTATEHDSGRFAPMLKAALAQYGFNFSYTTSLADLNAANLAQYDALMIYANHDTIAPDQEKAVLDFVAGGKGLLPIHSASFCFQNSPAYIALVGARASAPRSRRVHDGIRQHVAPGDGRAAAVSGLGRDLRPHEAQSGRPHRPDGTRRRGGPRAVDVGADRGQGPRLLHRLRPRRARLEPTRAFTR